MFANKMKDKSKNSFGSMIGRAKTSFLFSFLVTKNWIEWVRQLHLENTFNMKKLYIEKHQVWCFFVSCQIVTIVEDYKFISKTLFKTVTINHQSSPKETYVLSSIKLFTNYSLNNCILLSAIKFVKTFPTPCIKARKRTNYNTSNNTSFTFVNIPPKGTSMHEGIEVHKWTYIIRKIIICFYRHLSISITYLLDL